MNTNYTLMNITKECFRNSLPEKCGTDLSLSTNLNMLCTGIFLKTEDRGVHHLVFQ